MMNSVGPETGDAVMGTAVGLGVICKSVGLDITGESVGLAKTGGFCRGAFYEYHTYKLMDVI